MVRMTRTSYKASASILIARYSKNLRTVVLCVSKFSLLLSNRGNHNTHLTSLQGIGFSHASEMMDSNGSWWENRVLTPANDGSSTVLSEEQVVEIILEGS